MWQDSLLSIAFDRASSVPTISHDRAVHRAPNHKASYIECMKSICQVGLDVIRARLNERTKQAKLSYSVQPQAVLERVMNEACEHLVNIQACRSVNEQLEYWNLCLHRSYIASEIYRPFLTKHNTTNTEHLDKRQSCIKGLADTVEAFLGLEKITSFAHQSWAAVHRGLSSGLLLAIMKEHLKNSRVQSLLERLVAIGTILVPSPDTSSVARPITRSISALSTLIGPNPSSELHINDVWKDQWSLTNAVLPTGTLSSSVSRSSESDSRDNDSPYLVRDRILWGS